MKAAFLSTLEPLKIGRAVPTRNNFIVGFINSIHQAEENIVPSGSQQIPILMVIEARSAAENDESYSLQEETEEVSLLMTPAMYDFQHITFLRQRVFKAMCVIRALLSTQAPGAIEMISY